MKIEQNDHQVTIQNSPVEDVRARARTMRDTLMTDRLEANEFKAAPRATLAHHENPLQDLRTQLGLLCHNCKTTCGVTCGRSDK